MPAVCNVFWGLLFLWSISLYAQKEQYGFFRRHFQGDKALRINFTISQDKKRKPLLQVQKLNQVERFFGNKIMLIDTTDLGSYRLVINTQKGKIIYLIGFCSPYEEWEVSERDSKKPIFKHALVIPYPKKSCYFTFQKRTKEGIFETITETKFQPNDHNIVKIEKSKLGASSLWLGSEDFSSQIDIAVISDGYTQNDMLQFIATAKNLFEDAFAKQPLSELKKMFNITLIENPSKTSSPTLTSTGFLGLKRYVSLNEVWQTHDLVNGFPYDHIVILRKSNDYEGAAIYNNYTIIASGHPNAAGVLVHEFGHSLFGLADEYVEEDSPLAHFYDSIKEPWEPNISRSNYSFKWANSPARIRFNSMVDSLGLDMSKVGAYEGAGYRAKGIYRPYPYCMMRDVDKLFCPICQDAIIRQVLYKCSLDEDYLEMGEDVEEEEEEME